MKHNIIFKITILFCLIILSNNLKAETEKNCKYVVGNGTLENPLTWNGKYGKDLSCKSGTAYDCTEVCDDGDLLDITDLGGGVIQLEGNLPYIKDIVQSGTSGELTNTHSTSGTIIPSGYFEVLTNDFEGFPIGTRILVEEFPTDVNGNFSVQGTILIP